MLSTNEVVEKYLKMAISNPEAPFNYNDTTFVNLKRLYDFVKDNSKDNFVFEEIIKEVIEKAYIQDGSSVFYELKSYETKSGHTEYIAFNYKSEYNEKEDTVHNTISF